jgi:transposase-like protein
MSTVRKHYDPETKVMLIKKHLLDKKPISDICDEYGLNPTLFYRWQKEFFENGSLVFKQDNSQVNLLEKQVKILKEKLTLKNEVLSELMEDYITLKKSLGGI